MSAVRQQWLILRHELSALEALKSLSFSRSQNPGFELREISANALSARYIERLESLDMVETPFGEIEEIRSVRYVYFDFEVVSLSEGVSLLKLIRPPAALKSFINALMLSFRYDVSVEKVKFALLGIYSSVANDPVVDRVVVDRVVASRVPIGISSTAKIEVTSTLNALSEFKEAYPDPQIKLDKISICLRMNHEDQILEVSAAGAICCTRDVEVFLMESLIHR